jgi:hypothetical protein
MSSHLIGCRRQYTFGSNHRNSIVALLWRNDARWWTAIHTTVATNVDKRMGEQAEIAIPVND